MLSAIQESPSCLQAFRFNEPLVTGGISAKNSIPVATTHVTETDATQKDVMFDSIYTFPSSLISLRVRKLAFNAQ